MTEGVVSFYSDDLGSGTSADIGEDGTYATSEPLKAGRYSVVVLPPPEPPPQDAVPVASNKVYENIPQPYRDPKQSGLTIDIVEGDNTLDISMTKSGPTK